MNESGAHVTIKDIAKACGVSATTVSLALRNHPRISDATKQRICEEAERLGYRRNPLVAALMTNLVRSHASTDPVPLAAVYDRPLPEVEQSAYHRKLWEGISRRAAELGFSVHRFYLHDERTAGGRHLTNMLYSRGICGVLVLPLTQPGGEVLLDWNCFSSVAIGYSMFDPNLHRVCPDQYHGIRLALKRLQQRGYSRPGLIMSSHSALRTIDQQSSGFYGFQYAQKVKKVIPALEYSGAAPEELLAWYRKHKPDVIISSETGVAEWTALTQAGIRVPEDVGLVALSHHPTEMNISGIDEHEDRVGATAVERLSQLLYFNEQGVPKQPTILEIAPLWVDGATTPTR